MENKIKENSELKDINLFFDIIYHEATYDTDDSYELVARYVVMNSITMFGKTYESQNVVSLSQKEIYKYLYDSFEKEGNAFDFGIFIRPYRSKTVNGIKFHLKEKENVLTRKTTN